jgi:plastocyanin
MIYSCIRPATPARRAPIPRSSLRIFLLGMAFSLSFSRATSGQQVTVTGKVELFREGSPSTQDSRNGVVWLTPLGDAPEQQTQTGPVALKQQLVQKNKTFIPHLAVVQVGSSISFPNKDPFFHNVFSLFDGKRFDLGLYEAGSSRAVIFDREGISYIFCNIHPEMSGVVVALKTPYYGISDSHGALTIPDVPPGRYELHVWHERAIPDSLDSNVRTILVSENVRSFGVLRVAEQKNAPPPHKNKYGQDYETPAPAVPVYPHP